MLGINIPSEAEVYPKVKHSSIAILKKYWRQSLTEKVSGCHRFFYPRQIITVSIHYRYAVLCISIVFVLSWIGSKVQWDKAPGSAPILINIQWILEQASCSLNRITLCSAI